MGLFDTITNVLSGGNNRKAANASQAAVDQLSSLQLPDIVDMQLQLEQMVQQGQITPEEAQLYLQEQSAMNRVSTDPRFQQAQMDALSSLQEIGNEGGLTAMDRAQLNQIQTEQDTAARGAREAIIQNAAERGLSGSGLELMSQMQNQQDSATRASQRGFDVAAQAQQRALAALQGAGDLGGQMQQTQFNQQADIARANDAINQFNTQNRQAVSNLNTQNKNQAAQANLAEKQRIADTNTATRNNQQQYNKNLAQVQFDNAYKKAGGVASGLNNQATGFLTAGQGIQNLIGSAAGAAAAASDENLKENVEEFNPSEFLDSLTSYKYNYKNPSKFGEGEQVGVLAQDLEKFAPQMVEDTPEGKMVDYNKAGGPLFASLADLNDRLKKIEGTK